MKMNGREVNGYKVISGILATVLAGMVIFSLTVFFDKSDQALTTSLQAKEIAVRNRQDIAVIYEKLSSIESKVDEIRDIIRRQE